mmetsp:Transcript_63301/g.142769  ORF Transcript_63301/g.142769 Transcript_63301/m.142769 type:complete len:440 (+) Transcript_63301:229-1548(+)
MKTADKSTGLPRGFVVLSRLDNPQHDCPGASSPALAAKGPCCELGVLSLSPPPGGCQAARALVASIGALARDVAAAVAGVADRQGACGEGSAQHGLVLSDLGASLAAVAADPAHGALIGSVVPSRRAASHPLFSSSAPEGGPVGAHPDGGRVVWELMGGLALARLLASAHKTSREAAAAAPASWETTRAAVALLVFAADAAASAVAGPTRPAAKQLGKDCVRALFALGDGAACAPPSYGVAAGGGTACEPLHPGASDDELFPSDGKFALGVVESLRAQRIELERLAVTCHRADEKSSSNIVRGNADFAAGSMPTGENKRPEGEGAASTSAKAAAAAARPPRAPSRPAPKPGAPKRSGVRAGGARSAAANGRAHSKATSSSRASSAADTAGTVPLKSASRGARGRAFGAAGGPAGGGAGGNFEKTAPQLRATRVKGGSKI